MAEFDPVKQLKVIEDLFTFYVKAIGYKSIHDALVAKDAEGMKTIKESAGIKHSGTFTTYKRHVDEYVAYSGLFLANEYIEEYIRADDDLDDLLEKYERKEGRAKKSKVKAV